MANDKAIEAAARAVCKANHYKPEKCDCECNKTGPCAEHIDVARAAITAYEAALPPLGPGPIYDLVEELHTLRAENERMREALKPAQHLTHRSNP